MIFKAKVTRLFLLSPGLTDRWSPQYPYAMKRRSDNWDAISPIFKFSGDVRTAFYTTNAVESLNSTLRRLNRRRSVFSGSQALLKALQRSKPHASGQCHYATGEKSVASCRSCIRSVCLNSRNCRISNKRHARFNRVCLDMSKIIW